MMDIICLHSAISKYVTVKHRFRFIRGGTVFLRRVNIRCAVADGGKGLQKRLQVRVPYIPRAMESQTTFARSR